MVRVSAAGGQLSVVGAAAVGLKLSVWWAGDLCFYSGVIHSWDGFKHAHTVHYDDGDVQEQQLFREIVRAESGLGP
jgi:hypothetical protein